MGETIHVGFYVAATLLLLAQLCASVYLVAMFKTIFAKGKNANASKHTDTD